MKRQDLVIRVVIVGLIAFILGSIFIEKMRRSRERSRGSQTINCARHLDAAIDQWAIDNGVDEGIEIPLKDLAQSISPRAKCGCRLALEAGQVPQDALGNPYIFGVTGPIQLDLNPATITHGRKRWWLCDEFGCDR